MKKGQTVFYKSDRTLTIRGRVECVHRDGSATVRALFMVDDRGEDRAGYLGYLDRRDRREFATEYEAA